MVFERVQQIITEHVKVSVEDIKLGSEFCEDLGADSLDFIEIIMAAEDEFDIEIPDDAAEGIIIVSDLVEYIKSALPSAGG